MKNCKEKNLLCELLCFCGIKLHTTVKSDNISEFFGKKNKVEKQTQDF
jgi:hypothetical protein